MYSIGEIISTYRKKKGLLQQDLADELAKEGITISYKAISNWERNLAEPSVTIFYKVCRILGITNMYEAYFGVNPADPFSSLTDEGREKAMDYINLLHASGMYEKQTAKIIPFRSIDIFENAVSAGTGNFLVDGPKETVRIDESTCRKILLSVSALVVTVWNLNSTMVRLHGYYNRNLLLMEKSASSL